jgi:hypothetical protein
MDEVAGPANAFIRREEAVMPKKGKRAGKKAAKRGLAGKKC